MSNNSNFIDIRLWKNGFYTTFNPLFIFKTFYDSKNLITLLFLDTTNNIEDE